MPLTARSRPEIAVGLLLTCLSLAGCYAAEAEEGDTVPDEVVATAGPRPLVSYEEFRKTLVWAPSEGFWVAEGDIPLRSEERIRKFYEDHYSPSGALTVTRIGSSNNIWSRADRLNLTYCISPSAFGADYNRVVDAMHQAAAGWENAANVRFVHVVAEDTNCTNANNNVKFNVTSPARLDGSAFYPDWPRNERELALTWDPDWSTNPRVPIGVIMHELGHVLGFDHEHIHVPGSWCEDPTSTSQLVTGYDSLSIMHYLHCDGSTNTTGNFFLTQRDIEGAQALYEAPTNVDSTGMGVVYARKQSTGDIYKKSGSTWTKVSGPVQAFLTHGNDVYALQSNFGNVIKYSGSGTTWTTVGGSSNQIFLCGGFVCATNTNGEVFRYFDGTNTWSKIGDPGAKFATAGSDLFGLTPNQNDVFRYNGSGTSWTDVGGTFADLIGSQTAMYGLTQDRQSLQKYSGSGTTWTTIGGPGRQWHAGAGVALYALAPNSGAIYRYLSSGPAAGWLQVGDAAARLYGQFRLFATAPNAEDIWAFDGISTWNFVGKP
ncbi:matrixin family metalloprotease [Sorangium sp. So ce1504]|uniref:matrixin family metalloprotease n=1 Tax=Sorangium sp. So ce1504 TaxID=3133337 RepID=UPI003F620CDB